MDKLRSLQGDTLDALVWRERSLGPADLPAVLELNPGLAALGPILPLGTTVTVPEIVTPTTPTLPLVQLWD
jgi:phage tail protein X